MIKMYKTEYNNNVHEIIIVWSHSKFMTQDWNFIWLLQNQKIWELIQ